MKRHQPTYSHIAILMASPTEPMPADKRAKQLLLMRQGLRALEQDASPTTNDWRVVSDAVNLMETVVEQGYAEDTTGLLDDAARYMGEAGMRHVEQRLPIRLSAPGIQAVRAVLEGYEAVLEALSERTLMKVVNATEKRIRGVLSGKRRAHDVVVVAM